MFDNMTAIQRDAVIAYLRSTFDLQSAFGDRDVTELDPDAVRDAAVELLRATFQIVGDMNGSIPLAIAPDGPERDDYIAAVLDDTDSPTPVTFQVAWLNAVNN